MVTNDLTHTYISNALTKGGASHTDSPPSISNEPYGISLSLTGATNVDV